MTDRDKLKQLFDNFCQQELGSKFNEDILNKFADYLLANGVIVPPCKVGDVVWFYGAYSKEIFKAEVIGFEYNIKNGLYMCCENKTRFSVTKQWGKTVFLTKEEAEEKLRGLGK